MPYTSKIRFQTEARLRFLNQPRQIFEHTVINMHEIFKADGFNARLTTDFLLLTKYCSYSPDNQIYKTKKRLKQVRLLNKRIDLFLNEFTKQ